MYSSVDKRKDRAAIVCYMTGSRTWTGSVIDMRQTSIADSLKACKSDCPTSKLEKTSEDIYTCPLTPL